MNAALSEKVVDKIKQGKICPKSPWKFRLERYFIIFLIGLSLLIGSIAFGIMLELISKLELFSIWSRVRNSLVLIRSFPYLWIAVMVVSLVLVYAEFLRTRHGYRYRLRDTAFYAASIIMAVGLVTYKTGLAESAEYLLEAHLPMYNRITRTPHVFWHQPENGLLWGTITADDKECGCLRLKDLNNDSWEVGYREATIRGRVELREGEQIRVIGDQRLERHFEAQEIRPWPQCGQCQLPRGSVRGEMMHRGR